MLDALFGMSEELRRELRYIRVGGFPFTVADEAHGYGYTAYNFAETLNMFPGLQLDQLIVEDVYRIRSQLHCEDEVPDLSSRWEVFALLETNDSRSSIVSRRVRRCWATTGNRVMYQNMNGRYGRDL